MDDRFSNDEYIRKLLSNLRAQINEDVTDAIDREEDMQDLPSAGRADGRAKGGRPDAAKESQRAAKSRIEDVLTPPWSDDGEEEDDSAPHPAPKKEKKEDKTASATTDDGRGKNSRKSRTPSDSGQNRADPDRKTDARKSVPPWEEEEEIDEEENASAFSFADEDGFFDEEDDETADSRNTDDEDNAAEDEERISDDFDGDEGEKADTAEEECADDLFGEEDDGEDESEEETTDFSPAVLRNESDSAPAPQSNRGRQARSDVRDSTRAQEEADRYEMPEAVAEDSRQAEPYTSFFSGEPSAEEAEDGEKEKEIVFAFGNAASSEETTDERAEDADEDFFSAFRLSKGQDAPGSDCWEVIDTRSERKEKATADIADLPTESMEEENDREAEEDAGQEAACLPQAEEETPATTAETQEPDFAPYPIEEEDAPPVIDCTDAEPPQSGAEEDDQTEAEVYDDTPEAETTASAVPDETSADFMGQEDDPADGAETEAATPFTNGETLAEKEQDSAASAPEELPPPDGVEQGPAAASTRTKETGLPGGFVRIDTDFSSKKEKPHLWMDGDETSDNKADGLTSRSVEVWHTLLGAFRRGLAATILSAVITALIGCWECLPTLRTVLLQLTGAERYIGAPHLIDLELLLLAMALFLPEMRRAIDRLRQSRLFTMQLAVVASAALSALYLLVAALVRLPFYPVALPAAFLLTMAQFSRLLLCQSALTSAEICINSRCGTASVLRAVADMPDAAMAFADAEDPPRLALSCARFTQTDDFLRRLEDTYCQPRAGLYASLFAVGVSVVFAVRAAILRQPSPIGLLLLLLASSLPLVPLFIHTWGICRLGMALKAQRMTVAGETAVYELAEADVLCLSDTEAFPPASVEIVKIKLSGEQRVDKLFENLSALFRMVGGPLCGAFTVSGGAAAAAPYVSVLQIEEQGIVADIDGERFFVGRGAFMEENGISFYYDPEDEQQLRDPEIAVLFVAVGDVGYAKLYLRYHISRDFETYVNRLRKRGVRVLLRTADPNIHSDMMERLSCLEKGSLGVLRVRTEATDAIPEVSSGLVAYGIAPKKMYATRFLFGAYIRLQRLLPLFSLVSVPATALICALLSAAGVGCLPFVAVICQLLFTLPAIAATEVVMHEHRAETEPTPKQEKDERTTK